MQERYIPAHATLSSHTEAIENMKRETIEERYAVLRHRDTIRQHTDENRYTFTMTQDGRLKVQPK